MQNLENLVREIKNRGAKKVLIQVPEGLKKNAGKIMEELQNRGIDALLFAKPCYGACDTADDEAKKMGCDLLVHIGHNKFYTDFETAVPVLYFPWFLEIDVNNIDFSSILEKKIGLLTNIQHITLLGKIKELLTEQGKEAVIGGQLLGCWDHNAQKIKDRVDAFLFVGSGMFHPLAVKEEKPLYILDMETRKIRKLDAQKFERIRYGRIFNARNAQKFAILVSTKKGQHGLLARAEDLKKKIEENQRKAFIVVMDEITDEKLQGIDADAYVNTACPRLADDFFSKPFINAGDLEKIFE